MTSSSGQRTDDHIRARLEAQRLEVLQLLDLGNEAAQAVELDQQKIGRLSRMDAIQQQAMAQDALRRRKQELTRIDAALERVSSGEYGACVVCGEDIAPARLELDPAATHCIRCADR